MATERAKFRAPSGFRAAEEQLKKSPNLYAAVATVPATAKGLFDVVKEGSNQLIADPLLRGDFSAYAPSTYINRAANAVSGTQVPVSAQGFPTAATTEMQRVQQDLNADQEGVLINALPKIATAGANVAKGLTTAATGGTPSPTQSSQPVTQGLTAAGPTTGNVEDALGQTLDGSYSPGGFRIIRRQGESPLLTNVTGAVQQPTGSQFVKSDNGRGIVLSPDGTIEGTAGFSGGAGLAGSGGAAEQPLPFTPAAEGPGFRRTVVTGQDSRGLPTTSTTNISGADLNRLGARLAENATTRPQQPRTYEEVLSGLRAPRTLAGAALASNLARSISNSEINTANRAENLQTRDTNLGLKQRQADRQDAQLGVNQQLADVQTATALTNARKAALDLGTEFEGVFEERPVDPENPLLGTIKTLTGFQTKGKGAGLPSFVPLEDLNAYRQALQINASNPDAVKDIQDRFKAVYLAQ